MKGLITIFERKTTIINKSGLHARPAATFVSESKKFDSTIMITNLDTGMSADAKSILLILTLSLTKGTNVAISAEGSDEVEAVNQLISLIDIGVGEESK